MFFIEIAGEAFETAAFQGVLDRCIARRPPRLAGKRPRRASCRVAGRSVAAEQGAGRQVSYAADDRKARMPARARNKVLFARASTACFQQHVLNAATARYTEGAATVSSATSRSRAAMADLLGAFHAYRQIAVALAAS